VALGAVTVQLFPREKLGQFCSAQAFFYQTILMIVTPLLVAPFFDWLKFNRGAYLWVAFFDLLAAIIAVKVYLNWKKKHESGRPGTGTVSATCGGSGESAEGPKT